MFKVEKNKERLKLEQGDDKVKDGQIAKLIELEREVSCMEEGSLMYHGVKRGCGAPIHASKHTQRPRARFVDQYSGDCKASG